MSNHIRVYPPTLFSSILIIRALLLGTHSQQQSSLTGPRIKQESWSCSRMLAVKCLGFLVSMERLSSPKTEFLNEQLLSAGSYLECSHAV